MVDLTTSLLSYQPSAEEIKFKEDTLNLINEHGCKCLYRDFLNPGHITGSALLLSADKQKVLMNHHKKLNKWIGFSGHADGDTDILNVARREVTEESGINHIMPVSNQIYDMDVHKIPATLQEPEHFHFDMRYLFFVTEKQHEEFILSDESKNLKWCTYEEARILSDESDLGMLRLLKKWCKNFVAGEEK